MIVINIGDMMLVNLHDKDVAVVRAEGKEEYTLTGRTTEGRWTLFSGTLDACQTHLKGVSKLIEKGRGVYRVEITSKGEGE